MTAKKGTTQVSRTAYNRYDALGRVLESTQTTGGTPYTMAYAYDRAGNLIRQRYPSDRVVDYVYDGAGRIAGAKTGADGWYAGGTGTNAVDYEPHGGVKQLLLGNGLWEQRRYNARLQPTQIGLGTAKATGSLTATGPTPTASLLLLDYSYGASSNNGNVLSQRIRVGTSLNQNQVYTYDALNRLKTAGEKRQRHRLVADLRLRPLRQPPGDGGGLPRVEPGADAPVDGRHRRRHQPAGRDQGSQHRRLRRGRQPQGRLGRQRLQIRRRQPPGGLRPPHRHRQRHRLRL